MNLKLEEYFSKFKEETILVIGDLILDKYIIGSSDRISPEAPVPIVEVEDEFFRLGGAANVVSNISGLGANVIPCGIIGNDDCGKVLWNILSDQIKNIDGIFIDDRPTTKKTRIIVGHQQMLRIDREDKKNINSELENKIFDFIKRRFNECSGIIISDYQKGILTDNLTKQIIKFCRENGKIIFVDPKGFCEKYIGANFIFPNLGETYSLFNMKLPKKICDDEINKIGLELYHYFNNLDALIITRGKDGITIIRNNDGRSITMSTTAKEVFDVSGAGDTVISTFALSYLSGLSIDISVKLANLAAGIVVGKLGTHPITLDELRQSIF